MRILKMILSLSVLSVLSVASIASANDCTDCQNGQRYCGQYDYNAQRWISGAYESCNVGNPPPPQGCQTQAGHSEYNRQYVSSTFCRAVRPNSNECIARGSATVSVDNLTCVYNNFDGCGVFLGTYEQACGWQYNTCGC